MVVAGVVVAVVVTLENVDVASEGSKPSARLVDAIAPLQTSVPVGGARCCCACGLPTITTSKERSLRLCNRPISVYRSPRRALTLCPLLCMGIQLDARFPSRRADALPANLCWHFVQANIPKSACWCKDSESCELFLGGDTFPVCHN